MTVARSASIEFEFQIWIRSSRSLIDTEIPVTSSLSEHWDENCSPMQAKTSSFHAVALKLVINHESYNKEKNQFTSKVNGPKGWNWTVRRVESGWPRSVKVDGLKRIRFESLDRPLQGVGSVHCYPKDLRCYIWKVWVSKILHSDFVRLPIMAVWFHAWDGNYIDLQHGMAMEYYWKHSKTTKMRFQLILIGARSRPIRSEHHFKNSLTSTVETV